MRKIVCKECNQEIDITSKKCPNCGYKNKIAFSLNDFKNSMICNNCGKELTNEDEFCPNCGKKKNSFLDKLKYILEYLIIIFKRNKIFLIIGIIIIILLIVLAVERINYSKDISLAISYYEDGDYADARKITSKYPSFLHFTDYDYLKIENSFMFTYDYEQYERAMDGYFEDYEEAVKNLIYGYKNCLRAITNDYYKDYEKEVASELREIYKSTLLSEFGIGQDELNELINLESDVLEDKIAEIAEQTETENTCELRNIRVINYSKYKDDLTVRLKNNNGCDWDIKSYSEVRVYFTDGSYEDVYLGVNVNLEAGETYTFNDCYLGYRNENKTISRVTFID